MPQLIWAALCALLVLRGAGATAIAPSTPPRDAICAAIAQSISSASEVFYPGDPLYEKGIFHAAISSTENSKCVVEVGSPEDVGKALVILGRTRTPFAVKGGGHATNVHFSSTLGVHLSMYRFSEIKYDPSTQTVKLGAGLIWDDVYAALDPLGVTAVGGRVTGIGVAGFTLGGGYSWKTNQYGLAVDNIISLQLVKPNGKVIEVTRVSDPDLFWGLQGGQNNFGVVTSFTLRALPQTQVWGGIIEYIGRPSADALTAATAAFQSVIDPKAAIITAYNFVPSLQQVISNVLMFYDAPTPPPGIFDSFMAIPSIATDVGTRSYLSMVQASPVNFTEPTRVVYQGLPNIKFTSAIGDLLLNETIAMGQLLTNKSLISVSYDAEIFLPSIYSHNSVPTAFPPERNVPFQPFNIAYSWNTSTFDADMHNTLVASQARLIKAQVALGQKDAATVPQYPNYAIAGTPLQKMYGANVPRLMSLKRRVDPENVMGLAGGWKF